MSIYLIRVVGGQGVFRNNKIPAALSGHIQSIYKTFFLEHLPKEIIHLFLFPHTDVSAAWPLKTNQVQSNQCRHFKLGIKVGGINFLNPSTDTKSVCELRIWLLNSDVRSCTKHPLFLKQYILTNYITKNTVIQN